MKTRYKIGIIVCVVSLIPVFVFIFTEYLKICNDAVVHHLKKYSNLFDENTARETYAINDIGFPFGVHSWNVKECVDFVLDSRSENLENQN